MEAGKSQNADGSSRITTIKLTEGTKARLDKLRIYKRETYNEILEGIFGILNLCKANPEKARVRLLSIDRKQKIKEKIALKISKTAKA
jgi:hypothetical protein